MFQGRLRYYALRAWRSIWIRPAAYAVLAVLALAVTPLVQPLIPDSWLFKVEVEMVDRVLDILTSSMLAVAIFSLSTLVTQLNAAAQGATPRTRELLAEDRTAHNAISTFIGAFLFGVLGLIGLHLGLYDQTGLVVLFVLSLLLIALVVVNLILWIRRLSSMGGVGEAIERVEDAASKAFAKLARDPWMGGREAGEPLPGARPVLSDTTGFVQSLDGPALGELSDKLGAPLQVVAGPGDFVDLTRPLALVAAPGDEETDTAVRRAFIIGNDRDFASDPRYGVIVMSEIASRALSPAVNEPGTAIDVLGALVRVLTKWRQEVGDAEPELRHPHLEVRALDPAVVIADGFTGVSRDGAGMLEVGIRLQRALGALARVDAAAFAAPARRLATEHLARAEKAMEFPPDHEALVEESRREWQRSRGEATRLASG